jgi:hypothetical protein
MIVFIVGLSVGLIAGVFCTALCHAASDMERRTKDFK